MERTLSYPPESQYYGKEGYLHNLTVAQESVLCDVQKWIVDEGYELSDLAQFSLHPKLTLLRYLRANDFDFKKATEHISRNIKWREEYNVKELTQMNPEDILGCPMNSLVEIFPHWHCGYDKMGRPVLYKQYGKFDTEKIKEISSIDAVAKYHIWEQEVCMQMCLEQSRRTGYIVETMTGIMDVEGMTIKQVTRDFLTIVKAIANIDQTQYPETLGRFYIINVPSMFPFVWRMVKPWLDPAVASKIYIMGKREEWEVALLDYIGAENLPSNYGGKLSALSPAVHPYADHLAMRHTSQYHHQSSARHLVPSLSSGSSAFSDALDIMEFENWKAELEFLHALAPSSQPVVTSHEDIPKLSSDSTLTTNSWLQRYVPKFLRRSSNTLKPYLYVSICIYMLIAFTSIGLSGYGLANMLWTSAEIIQLQMWIGVVILAFSTLLAVLNFAGFIGVYTENRPLLVMYSGCLCFELVLNFVIGITCLIFASGDETITGISNEALSPIRSVFMEYNLSLGICSLILAFCSVVPLMLSLALYESIRHEVVEDSFEQIFQLQVVLQIAQAISLIFALVIIGYASYGLNFLLAIQFDYPTFAVYCLLYSGISIILCSGYGLWASTTQYPFIIRFYHCVVLPILTFVLLGTSILNFYILPHAPAEVREAYTHLRVDDYSMAKVQTLVQQQLLVGGVLTISVALFQLVPVSSGMQLYTLTKQFFAGVCAKFHNGEKLIVIWSVLNALFHIYVQGTYVIFAYRASQDQGSKTWLVSVWYFMGTIDDRYLTADGFLVSTTGILAILVGPMLLAYSVMIICRHKYRAVTGIVANTLEVYTLILYIAIEIHNKFANISVADPTLFVMFFVFLNIIRIVIPCLITGVEILRVVDNTRDGEGKKEEDSREMTSFSAEEEKHMNWAVYFNVRKRRDPANLV